MKRAKYAVGPQENVRAICAVLDPVEAITIASHAFAPIVHIHLERRHPLDHVRKEYEHAGVVKVLAKRERVCCFPRAPIRGGRSRRNLPFFSPALYNLYCSPIE
ncbi:hypothetical protein EDB87DRAFT_1683848 [Lactarius vividus]|nr:hypothetical protein EDB87DRAFT_1683848 [Lactarius vividus]